MNIQKCAELCQYVYTIDDDVYIEYDTDVTYIVIEGSDTIVNWIDNVSFLWKRNDMHRGFYRYSNYCIERYKLLDVINSSRNVILCAHSLGAACAILSVYTLIPFINDNIHIDMILFGCPMMGGTQFAKMFNKNVIKNNRVHVNVFIYKCGNDVVSMLPSKLFGYTHVQEHISLKGVSKNPIKNHNIQSYINAIKNASM